MSRVVAAFDRDLGRIQTGARAAAAHLDGILVDHHGARKPLGHVAAISVPDPHQIVIEPWEPSEVRSVGSAISRSRLGLTASIDGPRLRLLVPSLTEARRGELVSVVNRRAEAARAEIRRVRHAAQATLRGTLGRDRDSLRRQEAELDRLTAQFIGEIDRRTQAKATSLLDTG
jgi:ribosome recycling factor